MASHTYTVTDDNFRTADSISATVGDTLKINGYNYNSKYGVLNTVSVPGCSYSVYSNSKVYTLSGTLTTAGTYKITKASVYNQLVTNGSTLTITVSEPVVSYTVSFNSNGGSNNPSSQTVTSGSSITLPSPGTKSGYTFDGWYNDSTYVGTSGSSYTPTSSVTLTAKWTEEADPTYTYTLKFDANGGSGAPSTKTVTTTSTSYNMQIPYGTPTKSGYTFKGWNNVTAGAGIVQSPGEYVTFRYDQALTMTMKAVWEKTTYKYTLKYDANGGSNAPSNQSVTLEVSGDYTFNVSSTTPTRDGYKFLGWSKSSSATSPSYYAGDSISVSANSTVTLYAVWESTGIQGLRVNIAGTWYNVDAYVNVNGVWKQVTNAYVNVAGSWKEV